MQQKFITKCVNVFITECDSLLQDGSLLQEGSLYKMRPLLLHALVSTTCKAECKASEIVLITAY